MDDLVHSMLSYAKKADKPFVCHKRYQEDHKVPNLYAMCEATQQVK